MNEDSSGGIRSSHSELEAQHAEPGPAVGWACSCGLVLYGVGLQLLIAVHFFVFALDLFGVKNESPKSH